MDRIKTGVHFLKARDSILKKIIEEIGMCNLKPSNTYFNNLLRSIISQQLSVKAAKSIYDRLLSCVNDIIPKTIIKLDKDQLREIGLSYQKAPRCQSVICFIKCIHVQILALSAQ